jgi:predicted dehydrogenase
METLRAAVIGVGYLGRFHAQKYAALPGCRLDAVVDARADAAAAVAAETGSRALGDWRELLGKVDCVSIATPTPLHYEVALAFIESGAHVLVEKPVTETVEQAAALVAAAKRGGRVLQVGHLERFNPVVLAAEPLLTVPRFIECQRLAPFKERGTDVNVVLDLMIHDLDLVQSIVGSEITSVDAIGTPVFSQAIDIANARLRFANGCVANATASRVSMKTERKLRLFQDDAYFSLDLQQKILTVIRRQPGEVAEGRLPVSIDEQSFEQGDALKAEIGSFLASCRGERAVAVTGEDGLRALRTAIAITHAVHAGAQA